MDTEETPLATTSLVYALLGAFAWEICTTLDAEYSVIRSPDRRRFPLVFFPLSRICALGALLAQVVGFTVRHEIDCKSLFVFSSWANNTAIFLATGLYFRTAAELWQNRRALNIVLWAILLSQLALLYAQTFATVDSSWDPTLRTCIRVAHTHGRDHAITLASTYLTFGINTLNLCLTSVIFLRKPFSGSPFSRLRYILLRDGWLYFWMAFAVSILPAVFHTVPFDNTLNTIGEPISLVFTVIGACRLALSRRHESTTPTVGDLFSHSVAVVTNGPRRSEPSPVSPLPVHYASPFAGLPMTRADLAPEDFRVYTPPCERKDGNAAKERFSMDSDADAISLKFAKAV